MRLIIAYIHLLELLLVLCLIPTSYAKETSTQPNILKLLPTFNADSAYSFIQQQVSFGPRVPNTKPHQLCKKHIRKKLQEYGAKIYLQKFEALAFNGESLKLCNIIASFNPDCSKRILLAAHWDTRPFADKDINCQEKPISGANDGASGVGILLEIGRIISQMPTNFLGTGIDMIFFDGEDYGPTEKCKKNVPNASVFWCLGSQFWAQQPHQINYGAQYGILLDMVGSKDASFYQEGWSLHYSSETVTRIWKIAQNLGYANYFISQPSGYHILDDHYFVNKDMGIPMINIIDHGIAPKVCFSSYHHTHADNLELISKETLQAVGQTILQVIYTASSE